MKLGTVKIIIQYDKYNKMELFPEEFDYKEEIIFEYLNLSKRVPFPVGTEYKGTFKGKVKAVYIKTKPRWWEFWRW